MKKLVIFGVMVILLVGAMAGTAFATRYDSGYATLTTGVSPHGGYGTTTNKCSACHAVHNPGGVSGLGANIGNQASRSAQIVVSGSQALLRSSVANACVYCHVSSNFNIVRVYNGIATEYTTPSTLGHTNNGALSMTDNSVSCTDCHQVHGAVSQMVSGDLYMQAKILKAQSAYDPDTPAFGVNGAGSANQANMTKWCTGCHTYYTTAYNQDTHVMTDTAGAHTYGNTATTQQGQVVAYSASTDCRSCHQAGLTNQTAAALGANDYPHYVSGTYRFLFEATSTASGNTSSTGTNDGNCLICHSNGVTGVGLGF